MANPAELWPKTPTTGFSSRPPARRLSRVTKKSAVLKAAEVANRKVFSRSQNRWSPGASGIVDLCVDLITTAAAGGSIERGGSSARETCCAIPGRQSPRTASRMAVFGLRSEQNQFIEMTLVGPGYWPLVLVLPQTRSGRNGP